MKRLINTIYILGLVALITANVNCGGTAPVTEGADATADESAEEENNTDTPSLEDLTDSEYGFVAGQPSFVSYDAEEYDSSSTVSADVRLAEAKFNDDFTAYFCHKHEYQESERHTYTYGYADSLTTEKATVCYIGTYIPTEVDANTLSITMSFDIENDYTYYNNTTSCYYSSSSYSYSCDDDSDPISSTTSLDSTETCTFNFYWSELTSQYTANEVVNCMTLVNSGDQVGDYSTFFFSTDDWSGQWGTYLTMTPDDV